MSDRRPLVQSVVKLFRKGGSLLAAALAVLLSCLQPAEVPARAMSSTEPDVRIEVLVYSGRPNPTWRLSAPQAREFLSRVTSLPASQQGTTPSFDHGLGYSGLAATLTSPTGGERVLIGEGKATLEFAARTKSEERRDPDRALEKWVLQTGRTILGDDLLANLLSSKR